MKAYKHIILFLVIAASYSFAQFTNVAITTNTADQSEPTIAVSPINSNNVLGAWNEFRSGSFSKAGYAYSTNKGTTWTEKILVAPSGYTYGFDPSVAYDRYGNAFYCYIAYSVGPLGNVYVSRTTNLSNEDWNDRIVSATNHWNDKPFMGIDNTDGSNDGRIYVSWTDFSGGGSAIKFSYSTDHGVSFSTPITLSSNPLNPGTGAYLMPQNSIPREPTTGFVQGSMPVVGPNGEVYVVWAEVTSNGSYNGGTFQVRKSTDGGITFGSSTTVCQFTPKRYMIGLLDIRTYLPSMAVDPTSGNLYISFTDQATQSNTNARVKIVSSTNGGTSWSAPMIIGDFGVGWQFFPWVAVDENGRVSVFFMHSADLDLVDSYITESYDNGVSFLSSIRVSTQSSDPSYASWTHHYHGAFHTNGNTYCIWTDYRNENADPYFSLVGDAHYLATNKISLNYDATAHNNNHILERGFFGKLHEVFQSDGEIFYRRSSNNGDSWETTKQITSGNGSDYHPSIAAAYSIGMDVLCLVWQKKIDSQHYDIMYSISSDMGTNWSIPAVVPGCSNVVVSTFQSGPGPTPVVASFVGGGDPVAAFLLVYAAENGLHYRYSNSWYTGWIIPGNDIVPGSGGPISKNWYPCLATYNSQDSYYGYSIAHLTYDNRFYNVYSQIFYYLQGNVSWSNKVQVSTTGDNNRLSSVAVDYAGSRLAVWSGFNIQENQFTIRFRYGYSNGTWSSWYKEWVIAGINSLCPAVTYYNQGSPYPYGIDIVWYTESPGKQIRQVTYYGIGDLWVPSTDPNTYLIADEGMFANLTHERQNTPVPRQIWTDQSTPPLYPIFYNSNYLPKGDLLVGGEIRRAAEIADTSNSSYLRIELSEPIVTLTNGEEVKIPFKSYNYLDTLQLRTENIFEYLQTELVNVPNNAQSLTFKVDINASQPDTLSDGTLNTNPQTPFRTINFALLARDSSHILINNIGNHLLNNRSGIHHYSKEFTVNALAIRGRNIRILPNIALSGLFNQGNLFFSLVNVSIEGDGVGKDSPKTDENIIPTEFSLEQNYPNPFNPTTQIRYSVSNDGIVTLKVYDILGKEIKILVNEEKLAGTYTVQFNADNLSSGVYFYTISAGSFNQTKKMILLR
jgi:hypothetical protein